ncbi:MAG: tetratricopeptide repeat protein [Myxococcales bacterium]|nr:tetratricopeptide repeat protein [Myxococcales bacterium]
MIPRAVRAAIEEALLDEDEERALSLLQPHLGSDAAAWSQAGFLLDDLGQSEAALDHYARALELDPRCVSAFVGRGKIRAARREHEEAIADLDHALALEPLGMTYFAKACVLEEMGRTTEAAGCRAEAARLEPALFGRR